MAPKTAPDTPAGDPKHAVRATRTAGRKMRSLLLDAASRLFKERGLSGASIADIAAAADAFPSQITYYFRTKEALFVEAACRDMLYLARATEQAALQATTPRDYTRALVERTTERLHAEGLRAYASKIERHGWRTLREPDATSRRFWAVAVGIMVEGYAMGRSSDALCAEMLRVVGEQAATHASDPARLRLVGDLEPLTATKSDREGQS